MSMSDDEPYDADGDVSRFLHCPSQEAHMLPLSEPEDTLVGLSQYAPPATDELEGHQVLQTLNAAPDLSGHQVPTATEFQRLPAPQTLNAAPDLLGRQVPATEFQGLPAPQTLNATPDFGLPQAPITGFQGHPVPQTLGVAPDFGLQAPTTEFHGHPVSDFGLPVPAIDAAEHYQAPIINAEQYQASAMVVEYHQPMAVMDNIQPTQMLTPEMHHQAYGCFPDPTPMHCDGVNESSLLQANMHMPTNGVIPHPSPSLFEQLVNDGVAELAAIIRDVERGHTAGAAGAALNDVHPVKEEVFFRPFIRAQLDCSRCRSVREVVCQDERRRMHFMVHASDPETIFQHAIVDRMSLGADGHFRTDVLLHHDLRRRDHEWVHNFIARSVEMMKRNRGQIQDSSSYDGTAVRADVVTAPPPSHHAHMGLEAQMLNTILSAPAATTAAQPAVTREQQSTTGAPVVAEAAGPEAAQRAVAPQEQQISNAPGVAEAAVPEAAYQPAVTPQEQEENTGAPGVAEAAVPEAAEPAVTAAPQEQETTDAPAEVAEAGAPQAVQPAISQNEENKDAGPVFAPFNWQGFEPYILESSHVKPYDPESDTNVLLYPSLVEQLRQTELERKESKRLSKMPAQDTTAYLQMSDEDSANEPKLGSLASFRRLCQRDPTYRLYSRRVNCIKRKITKLQQTAARVGPRGMFAIKQKMETYKREKAELYDMINKAMQENESGGNNGAGPSNRAEPSNRAGPSDEAGTSNNNAVNPSNTAIPSSDGAGTSDDAAGPSNAAILSSDGAGISNDAAAGPSNTTAIVPSSNCAGPSGIK